MYCMVIWAGSKLYRSKSCRRQGACFCSVIWPPVPIAKADPAQLRTVSSPLQYTLKIRASYMRAAVHLKQGTSNLTEKAKVFFSASMTTRAWRTYAVQSLKGFFHPSMCRLNGWVHNEQIEGLLGAEGAVRCVVLLRLHHRQLLRFPGLLHKLLLLYTSHTFYSSRKQHRSQLLHAKFVQLLL